MGTATRDADLVQRLGEGDEDAIGVLYDRFGRSAFALARRITGDRSSAEEVVQEAFLDAWRAAPRFDPGRASASTWLFTFVHRRSVDAVRRASARPRAAPEAIAPPDVPDPLDVAGAVVRKDEAVRIRDALGLLPERERQVLELAYLHGLSQSEIAGRLREPLGTVKSRTHAALARMRRLLEEPA